MGKHSFVCILMNYVWSCAVSSLQEPSSSGPSAANKEAKELAAQMSFTSENSKPKAQEEDRKGTSVEAHSAVPQHNAVHTCERSILNFSILDIIPNKIHMLYFARANPVYFL